MDGGGWEECDRIRDAAAARIAKLERDVIDARSKSDFYAAALYALASCCTRDEQRRQYVMTDHALAMLDSFDWRTIDLVNGALSQKRLPSRR